MYCAGPKRPLCNLRYENNAGARSFGDPTDITTYRYMANKTHVAGCNDTPFSYPDYAQVSVAHPEEACVALNDYPDPNLVDRHCETAEQYLLCEVIDGTLARCVT